MTIHDSVPSKLVHDDLRRVFKKVWPGLQIFTASSPRQQRGSDDCGVFMVAHIIADYLKVKIADAFTLPSRLRPLLVKISKGKMHKADALIIIRDALLHKRHEIFNCGRSADENNANIREPCKNLESNNSNKVMLGGNATLRKEKNKPVKKVVKLRPRNTTHQRTAYCSNINSRVEIVLKVARQHERNAAQNNLCYMLVAVSLANVRDGMERSLPLSSLYYLRRKCGFMRGQQDVAETLMALQQPLAAITRNNANNTTLIALTPDALLYDKLFVQSDQFGGLPPSVAGHSFALGAAFIGNIADYGAEYGHYKLTLDAKEAVVGLYCKECERQKDDDINSRELCITNATNNVDVNCNIINELQCDVSHQQSHNVEMTFDKASENVEITPDDEKNRALHTTPQLHLNGLGRRPGGHVCPRTWYVYSGKPQHVTQMAWNAITPQTRQQHLRWINEIRAMPDDLLNVSFPTALLELVRRMAVARKWKWSTISKIYANIKAALLYLPLYTNQLQPIKLNEHPEWRAGMTAALRYNRETPATTFAPVTLQEVMAAKKKLGYHTEAALYLIMMWAFAARAGDIMNLAVRDITRRAVNTDGTVPVPLTIRRGKGARFRGPYQLGSLMTRQDASTLHALMCRKTPHQYLFSDVTLVKNAVRYTLRQQNPLFVLPSLRKGVALHMAAMKVPQSQIMLMTGHTRLDTLHRYLGCGRQLTTEGVTQRKTTQAMSSPTTRIRTQST